MARRIEKTVKELCLVCRGEKWLPRLDDPARSQPCPHCQGEGWVLISPASLGEDVDAGQSDPDPEA